MSARTEEGTEIRAARAHHHVILASAPKVRAKVERSADRTPRLSLMILALVLICASVAVILVQEKHQVRPEVVLVNSHDKSSAYQLHCGLFRLVCTNGMVDSDDTFQRISIKHSGFNSDSVVEASFKVLNAVPDIMNRVQLFQDRILTDAEQLAVTTGAAVYRWQDLAKAPVSPSMHLIQDVMEMEPKIFLSR